MIDTYKCVRPRQIIVSSQHWYIHGMILIDVINRGAQKGLAISFWVILTLESYLKYLNIFNLIKLLSTLYQNLYCDLCGSPCSISKISLNIYIYPSSHEWREIILEKYINSAILFKSILNKFESSNGKLNYD